MRILDPTCSAQSMWYQKNQNLVIYTDKRVGRLDIATKDINKKDHRIWIIKPNVISDWLYMPFKDEKFDMVVFDPPHIIKPKHTKLSGMHIKYGFFHKDNWKYQIEKGVKELFRVLKNNGFFILKWNEEQININEILKLIPYKPLFGTRTGQKNNTHWILFLKYDLNSKLDDFVGDL